jgi:hypothetical protein
VYGSDGTSLEENSSISIDYKGYITLVHETFNTLFPPNRLMDEGINSYSEFGSDGTSLEEDSSMFIR